MSADKSVDRVCVVVRRRLAGGLSRCRADGGQTHVPFLLRRPAGAVDGPLGNLGFDAGALGICGAGATHQGSEVFRGESVEVGSRLAEVSRGYGRGLPVGRRTVNLDSLPGPALWTEMRPPWASTSAVVMLSPRPLPYATGPMLSRLGRSGRTEMVQVLLGAIPTPVSSTASSTFPFSCFGADRDLTERGRWRCAAGRSRAGCRAPDPPQELDKDGPVARFTPVSRRRTLPPDVADGHWSSSAPVLRLPMMRHLSSRRELRRLRHELRRWRWRPRGGRGSALGFRCRRGELGR